MKLRYGDPEEVGMEAERIQRAVHAARGWVAQGIHSALVLLVARRGVIVLHEAIGGLTPEKDSPPVQLDTLFPLASLTKPVTATAIMLLVEDGLLSLTRPVSEYLPEFVGEGKEAVRVHHLLTHTSGLREEEVHAHAEKKGALELPPAKGAQHPWFHEFLYPRWDAPLWKAPGIEMSYCSYGYDLLGEIVWRVSGKPAQEFIRERIFEPLGMKDSYPIVPEAVKQRVVQRPVVDVGSEWLEKVLDRPSTGGGGVSTARDMAVFGQMFLNRGLYGETRLLSPASVAQMTSNQIPGMGAHWGEEYFPEASWGLGWDIHGRKTGQREGALCSPETFSHEGYGGVFLWVDPVYEIVGVYFSVELRLEVGCKDLFMNAVTAAVIEE